MASKPSIRDRVQERVCPNCGAPVARKHPKGPAPTFCSKACKVDMNNRLTVEGRNIIAFVKAWRVDRGSGEIAQQSLAQICEIVDYFNAEDLRLGRPRADYQAAALLQSGLKYFDRRRPSNSQDAK